MDDSRAEVNRLEAAARDADDLAVGLRFAEGFDLRTFATESEYDGVASGRQCRKSEIRHFKLIECGKKTVPFETTA